MTSAETRALIATLPQAIKARIAAGLDEAAARVAADARERLDRTGIAGAASVGAPTDPRSVEQAIATGRDPDSGAAIVTVDVPFAAALEYGTVHMPARPFLRPAAAEAESEIRDRLATALAETCRAALEDAS